MSRKFADEVDKYVALKLPLNLYKATPRTPEIGFQIAGVEVREKVRNCEKRLLKLYFHNWLLPYFGNLKGWKHDSPIYILYQGKLVSGLYLCDRNEFNEDASWGQLHYFYTHPAFRRRGLHSILFKQAIDRAKSWNLQGVMIVTNRYLLPEVYIRWGAIPWKEIEKVQSHKASLALAKSFLKRAGKSIQVLTMRL